MRGALSRHGVEIALGALVVAVVGLMIVPLPTWLLDVLLATNLTLAVLLLLSALFVRRALSFGALPTILLVTTLFRLALNVSSTRLILLQADAGAVIGAFGDFVVQGNYVVGAVVFLVITLIQFVVIARGSERVAEVGARFTLDAMPGKQLAIDADLRAGVLDAEAAAERRRELSRESQFYGAMDGAMKFVKGDAIASIAITVVNLVGGLAIGIGMRDLDAGASLEVYGLLTIGDGLVSQIPALLISTAAGLVVTRVASDRADGTLGRDIGQQVFGDWRALAVAAVFSGLLAVVPGLPLVPFAVLAAVAGAAAFGVARRQKAKPAAAPELGPPRATALELRVGAALAETLTSLEERLAAPARALYAELGVRLPAVPARVEPDLEDDAYAIAIGGVVVDRGRCPAGRRFALGSPEALRARDPEVILDGDGGWLRDGLAADTAEAVDPVLDDGALDDGALDDRALADRALADRVLADRVLAAARRRPAELMGLHETQRELDRLAREAPALVRTVVPGLLELPRVTGLLRGLLSERVSVRPLREILEAVAQGPIPDDADALLGAVRARLARALTHSHLRDGALRARPVDPMIEEAVREALVEGGPPALAPELAEELLGALRRAFEEAPDAVLLTQPDVRLGLSRLVRAELPHLTILSYRELDPEVPVERLEALGP